MEIATKRAFKNELYDQFARIGKALASAARLEMLELLAQGERAVEDIAAETGLSVANASQHLQVLRHARLVEVRRAGVRSFYRLADASVFRMWQGIREAGEKRLAEIEGVVASYLGNRGGLEPVTARELRQRIQDGQVMVLDVRPPSEYAAGHIRGAVSIPVTELSKRLRELPRDREIVAYCRGPYCVFADDAVSLLRARGYRAHRLAEGYPDWAARGLPVEFGVAA